jgi:hypothetical protein
MRRVSDGITRLGNVSVALALAVACGSDATGDDPARAGAGSGAEAGAGAAGGFDAAGAPANGGQPEAGTGGSVGGRLGGEAGAGASGAPESGGGEGGAAEEPGGAGGEPGETAGAAGDAAAGAAGADSSNPLLFDVNVVRASDVNPDAPGTVGIVTFSVDLPGLVAAHIEFGLDLGYGMVAPVDLTAPDFRALLLGMKPSRTYHFRVVVRDATQSYTSADYTLSTGAPTDAISIDAFSVIDEGARERGFIVGSYWAGMTTSVPFILDADGEIVWWRLGMTGAIARARLSADGKNMWCALSSNTGAALRRTSMDGLEFQSYENAVASHDITPVTGATMAYLEYGESDCDSIYEIDPSGATREVFESQGIVTEGQGVIRCHGNALRYSAAEDVYTFSEWHEDLFVITRAGEVAWRLGDRVSGGNEAWGGSQHGHHLLADSLLLFANRTTTRNSEVIEYALDGTLLRSFPSSGFTANLGDVQRLPGGNTLIVYSNAALAEEVDAAGTTVLRIEGADRFGYLSWRPTLYGPTPDTDD